MIDSDAPPAQTLEEAIQPPTHTAVASAVRSLLALGTLSGEPGRARVTTLGRLLAALPVSVPLGRLLVAGEALGLGRQAAILAASLSLPDPFVQPYTRGDVLTSGGNAEPAGGFDPKAALEEARSATEDVEFFKPRLAHYLACGEIIIYIVSRRLLLMTAGTFRRCGSSDPLASLALFEAWQATLTEQGPGRAAQYAHGQHASYADRSRCT